MLVDADPSTQQLNALNIIIKEIRECKRHIVALQDDNDCLRKENAEIKIIVAKLLRQQGTGSSSLTSQTGASALRQHRSLSRGRSSERKQNTGRQTTPKRNVSILRNNRNPPPPAPRGNRPVHSRTSTGGPQRIRSSNAHVVNDSAYASEEAKAKLIKALPINTVRYCNKNVFLTLYNSASSANDVFKHLKENNKEVINVRRIKTRSRSDNYRCFAIKCSDLDFDDIRNCETLWHPGSIVGDMRNEPLEDQVIETAGDPV